jgi:hypothetical protein
MTDLHGEMPFTEGIGEDATPAYDNGKTIYLGCLAALEEGLELLAKPQSSLLPSLSVGDWWGGGNVQKWIKFGNLLKARWINKLNKKGAGSYLEGKYDVDAILAALNNAPQSNADNMIINHTDDNSTTHDVLGWDEPVDYSPLYSVSGMNSGYMATKMLYDNLTNFAGYGVEDPRADKILPWAYSPNAAAGEYKQLNGWRRTLGVDMTTQASPSLVNGPIRASYSKAEGGWYIQTDLVERKGDTVYVEATSSSKGYAANRDLLYRRANVLTGAAGEDDLLAAESGTYYTRVSSNTYLSTYAEACFIKAEVLFNKGEKAAALEAYKEGIKSHFSRMNTRLEQWIGAGCDITERDINVEFAYSPMPQEDIDAYMASAAVKQTAAELTLSDIMMQKFIAMGVNYQNWNDMRKYNYFKNNSKWGVVYTEMSVPSYRTQDNSTFADDPQDNAFYLRRWMQSSNETGYNAINCNLAAQQYGLTGYADFKLWAVPVWWDKE